MALTADIQTLGTGVTCPDHEEFEGVQNRFAAHCGIPMAILGSYHVDRERRREGVAPPQDGALVPRFQRVGGQGRRAEGAALSSPLARPRAVLSFIVTREFASFGRVAGGHSRVL